MAQPKVVPHNKTLSERLNQENVAGMICTAPFTIGFLLFMIVPMLISAYYAFCDFDILSPAVFTGLKNFQTMFAVMRGPNSNMECLPSSKPYLVARSSLST